MRGFFVLLLLSNVLYFSWVFYFGDSTELTIPAAEMPGNRLIMLSEIPTDERPPLRQGQVERHAPPTPVRSSEEAPSVATNRSMRCMRVSNIQNHAELDNLISRLRGIGAVQIETGEEAGVRTNYWVLLPPFQSREEANSVANRLTGQRVRDFFVVRSGEHENAISLGVFSTLERAKSRQAQINTLNLNGTKPEIEMMQLPVRSHWLAFRIGLDNRVPVEVIQSVGALSEKDCP